MKILIMGFTKLKYMPYMNFYLNNLDCEKNEVHMLYWNRDLKEDITINKKIVYHEFKLYQEDEVAKYKKLKSFYKYREFALDMIHEGAFDFIIILHTLPGVLILNELKKHYKGKYILDYRDSTYEENSVFKKMIYSLAQHAKTTFVSSDAFRKYLPNDVDIHTSHNILLDSLNHRHEKGKYGVKSDKIRIAFWGLIRHEEVNQQIISKIGSDERFELHYYGREQETALNLKKYAAEIVATNVFFHGEYKPEDRYEFVRNTDIIHNIYYDNNTMLAMGNKYYDGVIFYLPQLCMKGSYMGELSEERGIGIACDPYSESFSDDIYQYYITINSEDFIKQCDASMRTVLHDYERGQNIIKDVGTIL